MIQGKMKTPRSPNAKGDSRYKLNKKDSMRVVSLLPPDVFHRKSPTKIAQLLAQYVRGAQDGLAANGKPVDQIIAELANHHDPMVRLGALRYMLDVARLEASAEDAPEDERPIISAEPISDEAWLQHHSPKK